MIKATATIVKPDDVLLTVSITATAGELKQLREQLATGQWHPLGRFGAAMGSAIAKALEQVSVTHQSEA